MQGVSPPLMDAPKEPHLLIAITCSFVREVLHAGDTRIAPRARDRHDDLPDSPTEACLIDDRVQLALCGFGLSQRLILPGKEVEHDLVVPGNICHQWERRLYRFVQPRIPCMGGKDVNM